MQFPGSLYYSILQSLLLGLDCSTNQIWKIGLEEKTRDFTFLAAIISQHTVLLNLELKPVILLKSNHRKSFFGKKMSIVRHG